MDNSQSLKLPSKSSEEFKEGELSPNYGGYIALRTIVMATVALSAVNYEKSGVGQAQEYVNRITEICARSPSIATSDNLLPATMEAVRASALYRMNRLLGSVVLPKLSGGN